MRAKEPPVTAPPNSAGIAEAHAPRLPAHGKRGDRRFLVNQPAQISFAESAGEVWEARIRDISRRGMQFTVDRPMPPAVRLRIAWSGREVFGAVRYQQRVGAEFRLGIELTTSWDSLVSDMLAQQAEELRQAEAALQKTNQELAAALEFAREASQAKTRFLASISHELRTPLNGIIGFSQLLHDGAVGPVSPDQKDCLADVLKCSDHLLSLIDHVLDLTKIEAGKMDFHYEPVAPGELAAAAIDSLRPLADARRISVRLAVAEGIGIVRADPARLRQVIFNYLSNAIKFTPLGGRVALHVTPESGGFYRVMVEDNGVGIHAQDLPRLFSEFGQLGPSEKAKTGTGLGLAITRRIVEAQGGRVGVESALGHGSRFYAILPVEP